MLFIGIGYFISLDLAGSMLSMLCYVTCFGIALGDRDRLIRVRQFPL